MVIIIIENVIQYSVEYETRMEWNEGHGLGIDRSSVKNTDRIQVKCLSARWSIERTDHRSVWPSSSTVSLRLACLFRSFFLAILLSVLKLMQSLVDRSSGHGPRSRTRIDNDSPRRTIFIVHRNTASAAIAIAIAIASFLYPSIHLSLSLSLSLWLHRSIGRRLFGS